MKYIILSICLLMSLAACKSIEHTQADPINLTQYLLKSRGLSYDESDYQKYEGNFNGRTTYDFNDFKYVLEDDKAYILIAKQLEEGKDKGVDYEAFDLNVKGYPISIYNTNILKTNCAFYEVVYADFQGSPPYYLRKIDILSNFYEDVRFITNDYVIAEDYTMLPIKELLGKDYDPNKFYYDDGVRYID